MNRIILLFIIITGGLLLSGCNDFLDKEPDSRTEISSMQDIQELLVNAYPQAGYHLIAETMSDNVTDIGYGRNSVTDITDREMYYWEEGTDVDYDSPNSVWTGFYAGIATANHALEELEKYPDSELKQALTGEALLCRALGHFWLVNLFAEHYDPNTAETALGIPYVKKPEKHAIEYYTRATMQETYDMIEEDLKRGLVLIRDEIYGQPKYHFTLRAAHAFAARFYLYKGTDWERVIYHCNQAIPEDFIYEMRNYDDFTTMQRNQREFMRQYTLPSQPAILLSVSVASYWNDRIATCPPLSSQYVLSTQLIRQIVPLTSISSFSGTPWLYYNAGSGNSVAKTMLKSHGYFKSTEVNSSSGMTYLNIPMFTVEDVALMRIEAYIMANMYNYALRDLNMFISRRCATSFTGLTFDDLIEWYVLGIGRRQLTPEPHYASLLENNMKKMSLLKAVIEMRRMEFLQEGLRWFDIKRFHFPVEHTVYSTGEKMVLERHDKRRALQIPQDAQLVGVVPNER